jgi:uncharacterized membrane protein YhaH (DUF805 family)
MDFNLFLDPVTKHYFDFQGVTARRPFWMFIFFYFLITIALEVVLTIAHLLPLVGLWSLAMLLPALGIEVRRLHDIGKSGWWILIALIPILGFIYLIYLLCQPSTEPFAG